MPFYQESKTARAAAIGTIMPWTGNISSIPAGWIICDGSSIPAADYPLLARAMQDTYNAGTTSTFAGTFPNYSGNIVLPAILNRPVCDIETQYFGSSSPITSDAGEVHRNNVAATEITPYIGPNTDNGINTTWNDVSTDVIFTLNERTQTPQGLPYYSGRLRGNVIADGSGTGSKPLYFGPRKLGRGHLRSHKHGGRTLPSINPSPATRPGDGVIPWSNISFDFGLAVKDESPGPQGDELFVSFSTTGFERGKNGFGSGRQGRTVAGVNAENPPVNFTPRNVIWNPIKTAITEPSNVRSINGSTVNALSGGISGYSGNGEARPVKYGIGGQDVTLPIGYTDFYPDSSSAVVYGTLNSNPGWEFTRTTASVGMSDVIRTHTHDEFDVTFELSGLRPNTTINVNVTAPASNLNLDNTRNQGVLQVNFNTTQPGVTTLYLIRAY
jgi:microcystin-dependent protein